MVSSSASDSEDSEGFSLVTSTTAAATSSLVSSSASDSEDDDEDSDLVSQALAGVPLLQGFLLQALVLLFQIQMMKIPFP